MVSSGTAWREEGVGRSRVAPAGFIPGPWGTRGQPSSSQRDTWEKGSWIHCWAWDSSFPVHLSYTHKKSKSLQPKFYLKAWVAEPTNGWALKSTLKSPRPRPCSRLKNVEALGVRLRHWHAKYLPRDSNSLLNPKTTVWRPRTSCQGQSNCPLLLCFWEGKSRWWCEAKTTAKAFVAFFYYMCNW